MVTGKYKNWELYEVKSKSASSPFSLHMALFICCRVSLCPNIFSLYIYNIPEFFTQIESHYPNFSGKISITSVLWMC